MILSGHQPNYIPYPGLIGKILNSDAFIYVSNVQFERKSWQNRNKIKGSNGPIWLTIPTIKKGLYDQAIKDVEINNEFNWRNKHFDSIRLNYKKSKYYNKYIDFFYDLYSKEWEKLADINIYIMNYILSELNCNTRIFYDTDFNFDGKKTDLLVEFCKTLKMDTYLSNKGSEAYVDLLKFEKEDLKHIFIDYKGVKYRQCFGEFVDNMSIIDMFFNLETSEIKNILQEKNNYRFSEFNKIIKD